MDYDANPMNPPTARFPTTYIRQSPHQSIRGIRGLRRTLRAAHTSQHTLYGARRSRSGRAYFICTAMQSFGPNALAEHHDRASLTESKRSPESST